MAPKKVHQYLGGGGVGFLLKIPGEGGGVVSQEGGRLGGEGPGGCLQGIWGGVG